MDKYVTATEANQRFSELLRDVSEGSSYTVTSRGRPVAHIMPADNARKTQSLDEFAAWMDTLPVIHTGPWKREDLYDRSDRTLP